jgi:hypothetical protein
MKVRFQHRLKDHLRGHLRDPVAHRRNTQGTHAPAFLGYFHPANCFRMVAARRHPVPELIEVILQAFLKALDRLPVDPSRSPICFDQLIRFQDQSFRYLVRFRFLQSVPPFRLTSGESSVTQPLCSAPITGVSSLVRVDPPLCRASILSLLRGLRLRFSLAIAATGSHVPHDSLISGHAAFMPEVTCPVHRFPARSSRRPLVRRF